MAATTRTLTVMSLSLPTRLIRFSCRARNTLACAERLMSPISSRKSVPPSACSNLPLCCLLADVNDPFSCPKSSLSINSDGMAAQLTSMNGCPARRLCSCSRWATSSLPVPLAPLISTRASDGATFSISRLTETIAREEPISSVAPRFARNAGAADDFRATVSVEAAATVVA